MNDRDKTKEQLISELEEMRKRIVTLEAFEANRKQIEEEPLLQAEIMHNMAEGVVVTRVIDATIVYTNPKFEEMFGYGPDELIGRNISAVNAPTDKSPEEVANDIQRSLKKTSIWQGEVYNVKKDGTPFWCYANISTFRHHERGEVWVDVHTDITERKRIEEALRQTEARYKQLAESITDVFYAFDENLKYTYWNKASEELTGISAEDALGKHLYDVFPKNKQTRNAEENYLKVLREKRPQYFFNEYQLGAKDYFFEISAYPSIGGLSVFVKDITERRQAEEALRQSEEKLRLIFETLPEGITILDTDGKIVQSNKITASIYGYDNEEEIIGLSIFELIAKREHTRIREIMKKTLKEGPSGAIEVTQLRKDRSEFPAEVSGAVLKDASGNPTGLITIMENITERKKAEEREKQLQQELITSGRLAIVGQMAAGIAHEINNPLTGVVGFAGLLLKKDLPEDIKKDVNLIYEGAQRITDITSKMLTFARKQKPERTLANINDILETTLIMRSYEMKSSNIEVITELDPDLPMTMVDAGQIQQVFLNIILNAEIEMWKAHSGGNLVVKTKRINNTIRISFKDDGPGITKKNIDRLFTPFFTTRDVGEGTGLGLSVSYGIITQHGGKIYAKSTVGKGATFFVELPIVTKIEQLKLAEPVAEVKKVAGARILVADDEPAIKILINRILSDEGYEIEMVGNGDDALKKLDSEDYDIILLDVRLPGMNGIAIYEHLLETAESLTRKVIFVTGDVMSADTMTFIISSGAPYITKPFDTEQLLKSIGRILGQKL